MLPPLVLRFARGAASTGNERPPIHAAGSTIIAARIVPPMASGERALGVWLGTSVRFVINLTVTPTLYIVSGTSDPLAVGRRISCVSA
jgi:hypothetical protein